MSKLNVLMVAPWYPINPVRFLSDAFERMGLGIFRVGATYNDHGHIDWGSSVIRPDVELPREYSIWNVPKFVDIATSRGFTPDFIYISEENYQTDILMTNKLPSVFHSWDGWPDNYLRGDNLSPTKKYTNHPLGIKIHPRKEEAPGWSYLPAAWAPWAHPFTNQVRDIDFVLHATPYTKRPALCDFMRKAGLTVADGWVNTKRYAEDYNRGHFTFHNAGGQQECKFRLFEAAGMGCVNISDDTDLLTRNGFWPYEHYIPIKSYPDEGGEVWPDFGELADLIKDWIGFGTQRMIRDEARKLVLSEHTYYHRASRIISDLGLGVFDPTGYIEEPTVFS